MVDTDKLTKNERLRFLYSELEKLQSRHGNFMAGELIKIKKEINELAEEKLQKNFDWRSTTQKIIDFLKECGETGATIQEIANYLNTPYINIYAGISRIHSQEVIKVKERYKTRKYRYYHKNYITEKII